MNTKFFIATIVLSSLVAPLTLENSAYGQNYDAMMQQYLQQDAQLTQQMQQMQQGMVQQNMQNPQVQQAYQQHLAQGGRMSFEQFAYGWSATGGYTPEGMARYNQNERAIQQRDQQAIQDYRQNQNQNYQAMQEMHQRNAEIAHHRGNTLQGTTDYRDPSTGNTYNLPHTNLPNSYYNPNTGDTFYGNPQGNYQRQGMDGYSYDLEEDE